MADAQAVKRDAEKLRAKSKTLASKTKTLEQKKAKLAKDAKALRDELKSLKTKAGELKTNADAFSGLGTLLQGVVAELKRMVDGVVALAESVGKLIGEVLAKLDEALKIPGWIAKKAEELYRRDEVTQWNRKLDGYEAFIKWVDGERLERIAIAINTLERAWYDVKAAVDPIVNQAVKQLNDLIKAVTDTIVKMIRALIEWILKQVDAVVGKIIDAVMAVQAKLSRVKRGWRRAKDAFRRARRWIW